MDGGALLVQAALGAALFYLQRNLIDVEILSQGRFEGYVPPDISDDDAAVTSGGGTVTSGVRSDAVKEQHQQHLTLDGTTLLNLEIPFHTSTNTLFHTINHCAASSNCSTTNTTSSAGVRPWPCWIESLPLLAKLLATAVLIVIRIPERALVEEHRRSMCQSVLLLLLMFGGWCCWWCW